LNEAGKQKSLVFDLAILRKICGIPERQKRIIKICKCRQEPVSKHLGRLRNFGNISLRGLEKYP